MCIVADSIIECQSEYSCEQGVHYQKSMGGGGVIKNWPIPSTKIADFKKCVGN